MNRLLITQPDPALDLSEHLLIVPQPNGLAH